MSIISPQFPTGSSLAELCKEIKSVDKKTRELGPWESGAFSKLASHGCLAGWIKKNDLWGVYQDEILNITFIQPIFNSYWKVLEIVRLFFDNFAKK